MPCGLAVDTGTRLTRNGLIIGISAIGPGLMVIAETLMRDFWTDVERVLKEEGAA